MFGGYLAGVEGITEDNWNRLEGYSRVDRKEGNDLASFIRLMPVEYTLHDGTQIISATLFFEFLHKTKRIVHNPRGQLIVAEEDNVVDTHWSNFWLSTDGYILIGNAVDLLRIHEILSFALFNRAGRIYQIRFDIAHIFADFAYQWLGAFVDRQGNIRSGSFYGENICADPELGEAYIRTHHKNQVGFLTDHFGPEIKVKVTREGYIQFLANL